MYILYVFLGLSVFE